MPTAARRSSEERKRRFRAWALVGTVAMAVAQYISPGSKGTLIIALLVIFGVSVPLAKHGYVYRAKRYVFVPILVGHLLILIGIGWWRWPRIKVSPNLITFQGMSQETYDFTIRNDTDSDAYLVRLPFLVPNGLDGKIEPRIAKDDIDSALPIEEYGHCYGNNGKEYVVVEIPTLASHQARRFSLVYSGGQRITAKATALTSVDEQPPHSPIEQTGGISGDYRICHMQGHVK